MRFFFLNKKKESEQLQLSLASAKIIIQSNTTKG